MASTYLSQIEEVKTFLHAQFTIKDLGVLKFFIGLEVARSRWGINLSQHKYIMDLLFDIGFLSSKLVSTPMVVNLKLSKLNGLTSLQDVSSYKQIIGRLLYSTTTHPDISFVFLQLS